MRRHHWWPLAALLVVLSASVSGLELESIQNREWVAEDIGGLGVLDDPQPVVLFADDGSLEGRGGCNDFFGEYELDGDVLSLGPVGSTRKACPPPVMDQEHRFLAVLGSEPRLELDGPFLSIYPGSGDSPTRLRALGHAALTGTVDDGEGSELPPDAMVTVGLYDISSQDAPPKLIGQAVLDSQERFPFSFTLSYDPGQILESHSYALQAWIKAGAGVLFVTTDLVLVSPQETSVEPVEVLVRRLGFQP